MPEQTQPIHNHPICECCGSTSVSTNLVDSQFQYKDGSKIVILKADLPVLSCPDCEFEYTTVEAETLKTNAICKYLGLLTPAEITSMREKHNLTKAQLSDISGLGTASLSRWESGSTIQSKANDNLLRLLSERRNIKELNHGNKPELTAEEFTPIFAKLIINNNLIRKSENFQL